MIKVIAKSEAFRINCYHCHATLEFEEEDVQTTIESDNSLGIIYQLEYLMCPMCGKQIRITEQIIDIMEKEYGNLGN